MGAAYVRAFQASRILYPPLRHGVDREGLMIPRFLQHASTNSSAQSSMDTHAGEDSLQQKKHACKPAGDLGLVAVFFGNQPVVVAG